MQLRNRTIGGAAGTRATRNLRIPSAGHDLSINSSKKRKRRVKPKSPIAVDDLLLGNITGMQLRSRTIRRAASRPAPAPRRATKPSKISAACLAIPTEPSMKRKRTVELETTVPLQTPIPVLGEIPGMQLRNRIIGRAAGRPAQSSTRKILSEPSKKRKRTVDGTVELATTVPLRSPVPFDDSLLGKLPVELRLHIYAYVLDNEIDEIMQDLNHEALSSGHAPNTRSAQKISDEPDESSNVVFSSGYYVYHLALLRTCRGMHREGMDTFYRRARIVILDPPLRKARAWAILPYLKTPADWDHLDRIKTHKVEIQGHMMTGLLVLLQYLG
ncbi:MAG: hypothetical protein Q9168_006870 [Polycauliona sp. 1 TL-2023]